MPDSYQPDHETKVPAGGILPDVDSPPPDEVIEDAPSTEEIIEQAESVEEIVKQQPDVDELLGRRS